MSFLPHGNTLLSLEGFSWNLIFEHFSKACRKFQISLKSERITGTLYEDQYMFVKMSRWIVLRMGNISGRSCGENQHMFYILLTPWCRVLLEKLTGLQLVKKFPAFLGNRRFIIALTGVHHLLIVCLQSKHPACECFLTKYFTGRGC